MTQEPSVRVVSLLASGTELVCALGLGDRLVARSHECDTPEWVKGLPIVSRPLFDHTGSSREIDDHVRRRLHAGEPLYEVDEERIADLRPRWVITQTHCEVCAPSPADLVHGVTPRLAREQVVALSTGTLEGILRGFVEVGRALGREAQAVDLVRRITERTGALRDRTRALPRRSVVCLEWLDPVFAMGNWGPELVELAGGEDLLGTPGAHSTTTPWQDVRDADPEALVVACCGFGIARTLTEMHLLAAQPGWQDLRAVRTDNVFVADGNLYFNRSGPSVFDSATLLAEMLHPEAFPPEHEGRDWIHWRHH